MIQITYCGFGEFNIQLDDNQLKALNVCSGQLGFSGPDFLASLIVIGLATQIGMIEAKKANVEDSP